MRKLTVGFLQDDAKKAGNLLQTLDARPDPGVQLLRILKPFRRSDPELSVVSGIVVVHPVAAEHPKDSPVEDVGVLEVKLRESAASASGSGVAEVVLSHRQQQVQFEQGRVEDQGLGVGHLQRAVVDIFGTFRQRRAVVPGAKL